jgi:hypothetical protein
MKKLKQLILLFLTFGCEQKTKTIDDYSLVEVVEKSVTKSDSSQKFSIKKAKLSDFEKAKNNFTQKILFDTSTFKKIEKIIHLPTDNGNVIFKDIDSRVDDSIEEYNYIGQFKRSGFYVVKGDFYEDTNYNLVNKHTGEQTKIWNYPSFSPSDNFIANLSMPSCEEGSRGIQIWKINKHQNNRIEKYIELEQYKWFPDAMFWETEETIILKVSNIDECGTTDKLKETDFYYLRMRIN